MFAKRQTRKQRERVSMTCTAPVPASATTRPSTHNALQASSAEIPCLRRSATNLLSAIRENLYVDLAGLLVLSCSAERVCIGFCRLSKRP
jgi:hypothetical protein